MIFNFYLGNHSADALNALSDVVAPIYRGLESLGHRVIGFGTGMLAAPAVNVLVEGFGDVKFTETLLAMKGAQREGFLFGVVCPYDIDADFISDPPLALVGAQPAPDPSRRMNLLRLLPQADFVWILLPQLARYEELCGSGKTALIEYGYSAACADPWPVATGGQRDIDVTIYGWETVRRNAVTATLRANGLNAVPLSRAFFPDFLADDVLRRTKLVLEMPRTTERTLWAPALAKALHFGAAIMCEEIANGIPSSLARYAAVCPYDDLTGRATEFIRSQRYSEAAAQACARFKTETSMTRSMAAALALPVFQRLAA